MRRRTAGPYPCCCRRLGPRCGGAAGWQPVPYARVTPADAWCERFGTARRGFYFTLLNRGPARELTLSLDRKALGLTKPTVTPVTGCRLLSADATHVRLAVPAQWTAVLAVNRPEARALAAAHRRELARFRE